MSLLTCDALRHRVLSMELIDRLTEDEVPVDELDEAYGIEEIVYCCRTIPCSSPTECPR